MTSCTPQHHADRPPRCACGAGAWRASFCCEQTQRAPPPHLVFRVLLRQLARQQLVLLAEVHQQRVLLPHDKCVRLCSLGVHLERELLRPQLLHRAVKRALHVLNLLEHTHALRLLQAAHPDLASRRRRQVEHTMRRERTSCRSRTVLAAFSSGERGVLAAMRATASAGVSTPFTSAAPFIPATAGPSPPAPAPPVCSRRYASTSASVTSRRRSGSSSGRMHGAHGTSSMARPALASRRRAYLSRRRWQSERLTSRSARKRSLNSPFTL